MNATKAKALRKQAYINGLENTTYTHALVINGRTGAQNWTRRSCGARARYKQLKKAC